MLRSEKSCLQMFLLSNSSSTDKNVVQMAECSVLFNVINVKYGITFLREEKREVEVPRSQVQLAWRSASIYM
jgi:hypothetical protein